jgi:hypothetical protein
MVQSRLTVLTDKEKNLIQRAKTYQEHKLNFEKNNPDITLEMDLKQPELIGYGISEEFLRFTIEEDFLPQLEKYCKKSKIPYNIPFPTKIILSFIFNTKPCPFWNEF